MLTVFSSKLSVWVAPVVRFFVGLPEEVVSLCLGAIFGDL